jgi:hypothetical protein
MFLTVWSDTLDQSALAESLLIRVDAVAHRERSARKKPSACA